MGRPHRFIDNESGIVELTSRCVQGRFLMRPSSLVNDRILGIIGYAQRMTGARLFIFNVQSNHDHGLGQFNGVAQMAEYERLRKGNLAKELGGIHDWKEKFWGRRYNSICLADDELTQQKRLRYIWANGVKDGLVDSPFEWPGVSPAWHLANGIWKLTGTMTPASVHYGHAPRLLNNRREVLTEAFHRHPERFVHGAPPPPSLPEAVWINPPAEKTTRQDALGAIVSTPDDLQHPPALSSYEPSDGLALLDELEVRH